MVKMCIRDSAYIGKLHADFPTKNNPQRPGTYVSDAVPKWEGARAAGYAGLLRLRQS